MLDPQEKELKAFSLTALFIVTGISSFLFYFIIYFLDGMRTPFFIWTGVTALIIGIICFLYQQYRQSRRTVKTHSRKQVETGF